MKKYDKVSTIPSHMMAVFTNKETRTLYTKEVAVPVPGNGEVLIKMAASPINPSDLVRIRNLTPEEIDNHIPGIEGSGKVIAAGKGFLPRILLGKRVTCCAVHPCSGTWAEYCITKATTCFPLGKNLSDEQGSMMLVNPMTAVAFFDIIKQEKHNAIINTAAAGALGRMIEFMADESGVKVINIVRNNHQKQTLIGSGSKYVLNSSDENFFSELYSLSEELKVTLALEAIGGEQTNLWVKSVSYGGKVLIYGNLSCENPVFDSRTLTQGNKSVSGFFLANWIRDNSLMTTIRSLFKVKKLLKNGVNISIQNRFTLNNPQLAVDTYLQNMTSGKVLFIPGLRN